MKKNLSQLFIIIPLVFLATGVFAAFSYTAPTAAPTSNNTDGPLDIGSTDQVKDGGLAVNAFQSRTGSFFAQRSTFTGLVRGGTPSDTTSSIAFGDSSHAVTLSNVGNIALGGTLQSDTLKTGGGSKPLCADTNGTFYICGAAATTVADPIYIHTHYLGGTTGAQYYIYGYIDQPISKDMEITIGAVSTGGDATLVSEKSTGIIAFIKNMFTANAKNIGVCYITSTSVTRLGSVEIYPSTTMSWNSLQLPTACDPQKILLTIMDYSPQATASGQPIKPSDLLNPPAF
jgi:hypothetical protein